ncbi:unnamed protein product [Miscanthus lutarioriparius]|uniref:Uncharacterized protein n=1 Tax=Miscanthus lutarioriparius TaxID=422564 RepID=A0A811PNV6_9POAL|nr:unnamed protein product [Miscanthus lutarioriparius]
MAPATANADLTSQNESRSGEDASHGRVSSSAEAIGQLGAQLGPAQLNTRQLEVRAEE